jgi:hypothetical protein
MTLPSLGRWVERFQHLLAMQDAFGDPVIETLLALELGRRNAPPRITS